MGGGGGGGGGGRIRSSLEKNLSLEVLSVINIIARDTLLTEARDTLSHTVKSRLL